MADGVTALGGGWPDVNPASEEAKLAELLSAGVLTGDALCAALAPLFPNRGGGAYYPIVDGSKPFGGKNGPMYALGAGDGYGHDYAIVNNDDPPNYKWDLIGYNPGGGGSTPGGGGGGSGGGPDTGTTADPSLPQVVPFLKKVRPAPRAYPHVQSVADPHVQMSLRLLWDKVYDLVEGKAAQATPTTIVDAAKSG